ncbi:unnamed protein product [Protopolystoma xenopodis]|uniref:Uncharacterized protein n=1 Tax=Protopolystoma xenopodis TaxID=117903 RepID=A0A3S5FDG0_9PLAT|nr:unnamed protein product [Protopolystoma xenopodis]
MLYATIRRLAGYTSLTRLLEGSIPIDSHFNSDEPTHYHNMLADTGPKGPLEMYRHLPCSTKRGSASPLRRLRSVDSPFASAPALVNSVAVKPLGVFPS